MKKCLCTECYSSNMVYWCGNSYWSLSPQPHGTSVLGLTRKTINSLPPIGLILSSLKLISQVSNGPGSYENGSCSKFTLVVYSSSHHFLLFFPSCDSLHHVIMLTEAFTRRDFEISFSKAVK